MKRALVTYSSSSDEREDQYEGQGEKEGEYQKPQGTKTKQVEPTSKKKKLLPKLSESLTPVIPIDDPSKHQGRVRTQPFVDGQFAVHVYVPISVAGGTPLRTLLEDVVKDVREMCPTLQVFSLLEKPEENRSAIEPSAAISNITTPTESTVNQKGTQTDDLVKIISTSTTETGHDLTNRSLVAELHLSLSRPVFVRSHQREDVKRAVKNIAKATASFDASFASFSILNNDEGTRSFLTVEIGAGHSEFSKLSAGLEPLLKEYRQPGYYAQPRYHISIAWILTTDSSLNPSMEGTATETGSLIKTENGAETDQISGSSDGKTIVAGFSEDSTERLNKKYGEFLRRLVLPIESICTKIGKHVNRWDLQ